MVKLRVAARVIPETDYNSAQSTPTAGRKFLVVVRHPEEWLIGTLAVEVQNTYKRIYKHDLGKVKYLKDADDFDLDPEQTVADVFVNEGKADRDGLDQEATIKVIQEQGQAVRYGSVVPDLTPVHYQRRPLPPVPKFNDLPAALGKRSHELANGRGTPDHSHGSKRFRQAEIEATQEQDELIPSVERSPELIEDTQTWEVTYRRPDETRTSNTKVESPELRRLLRDVVPATEDELELLPQAPPNFPDNRRNYVLGGEHLIPRTNGILQSAAKRSSASNQRSQLPVTPPTDPVVTGSASKRSAPNGGSNASRSPAPQASSSISKFKSTRRDVYDFNESDIEDSQLSPHAKTPLRVPRLVSKMSSIEEMPSQQQNSYASFNAQAALDPMDLDEEANTTNAFIAEKRHSVSMHNDFRNCGLTTALTRQDASDDETEIPATAGNPKQASTSHGGGRPSQPSTSAVSPSTVDKLTHSKVPSAALAAQTTKDPESRAKSAGTDANQSQARSDGPAATPRKRKKRSKEKRRDSVSEAVGQPMTQVPQKADDADPFIGEAPTLPGPLGKALKEIQRRRASDLDSPGEQLSQSLQESARRGSLSEANVRLADTRKNDESRVSTSTTTSTSTSRRSSSSQTGSSPSRIGLGITNSPRKNKDARVNKKGSKGKEPSLKKKLEKAKEVDKSAPKKQKTSEKSKDATVPAEDQALPSVEKSSKQQMSKHSINKDECCAVVVGDRPPCTKDLACKSHPKKAKRAVQGRSKPYDVLLNEYQQSNSALATASLPNWSSKQDSTTVLKSPASNEQAQAVGSAGSSKKIIPKGMTEEEFERLKKQNENTPVSEKPKKKKARKETPKPVTPAPEIKVTASDETGSSSRTSESRGPTVEEQNNAAEAKKSKSKTSPGKTTPTQPETSTKTPAPALNERSSATPMEEFENFTARLKTIKYADSSDLSVLQPVPSRATLKKQESSDRRSSMTTSDIPTSDAKTAPSVASSIVSKPKAATLAEKSTAKATPAKSTPRPAVLTKSSTSTLNKKAASPAPQPAPAPISNLKKLRAELAERNSREASKHSSPAPVTQKGFRLSNLGKKTIFGDEDSSSSSSDSDSDSSDDGGGKASGVKRTPAKGVVSAVPDKSIRDPTPDVDTDSDED